MHKLNGETLIKTSKNNHNQLQLKNEGYLEILDEFKRLNLAYGKLAPFAPILCSQTQMVKMVSPKTLL